MVQLSTTMYLNSMPAKRKTWSNCKQVPSETSSRNASIVTTSLIVFCACISRDRDEKDPNLKDYWDICVKGRNYGTWNMRGFEWLQHNSIIQPACDDCSLQKFKNRHLAFHCVRLRLTYSYGSLLVDLVWLD